MGEGAQGRASLREGAAEEPREEHHALSGALVGGDGAADDGRGRRDHRHRVRGLRVEHFLAPKLEEGQVVVLDNLNAHKGERVRQLVEARGCEVLFLPPYSP